MFTNISLTGAEWLWPALGLFAAVAAILVWSYRARVPQPGLRAACIGLKLLGVALLLLCLLNPANSKPKPGANFLAIMADNSRGLSVRDRNATDTRAETLRALLGKADDGWQKSSSEFFQLRRYAFDAHLRQVRGFSSLRFDGNASAMHGALDRLAGRFNGQPLAGVLLFTDGIATDKETTALTKLGAPVYPVPIGSDEVVRDLAIEKFAVNQTPFEDAPVTIEAQVASIGFAGREIVASLRQLKDEANATETPLRESTLRCLEPQETLKFRFQFNPHARGPLFYEIRVRPKGDENTLEATLENNRRLVALNRGGGPYRILYVSGRPNWEFKFLRRAQDDDRQVDLLGLIRIARKEPKFVFKGRVGEGSNPLFRGFDRKDEDTEEYDKPVFRRTYPLHWRAQDGKIQADFTHFEKGLQQGFPITAEDLFSYHAIVLDDVEAKFFKPGQMKLIEQFVKERGGGLLMLGGQESFVQGDYARTPLGKLLPIYLDGQTRGALTQVRYDLTPEGRLEPWVRVRDNLDEEDKRLAQMPAFQVFNKVARIKPLAAQLAVARDNADQKHPALVTQKFGKGRIAVLMIGDLWRWGMRTPEHRVDMEKAWRQMLQWLVTDALDRITLDTTTDGANVQVAVRDKQFQPQDNARVTLRAVPVAHTAHTRPLNVEPPGETATAGVDSERYHAAFISPAPGAWRIEAEITEKKGKTKSRQFAMAIDPAADELRTFTPNRALLKDIAEKTGGQVIEPGDLETFLAKLPERAQMNTINQQIPIWHEPTLFLLVLICLVAEWFLRRWKGLP